MSEKNNINFPRTIKEQFDYLANIVVSGLYSISISARVKSAKQINSTDDEAGLFITKVLKNIFKLELAKFSI